MLNKNYVNINGIYVDVTTVMDKSATYTPTPEEGAALVDASMELLGKYFDYADDDQGLWKMFGVNGSFWASKGWIIDAMKNHPDYNGNYQIVLHNQDMHRYMNDNAIRYFRAYVRRYVNDNAEYTDPLTGKTLSYSEKEKLADIWEERARKWNFRMRYYDTLPIYRHARNKAIEIRDKYYYLSPANKWQFVERAITYICDAMRETGEHLLTEEMFNRITDDANYFGVELKGVRVGHKISKVVRKICGLINIINHVDIQDASFCRQDGSYVERTKDMGWNKQYADFSDGINPVVTKMTAVISVNPIDFWTMSFGYNWASCHTIDKENRRGNSHNYSGCYCGGTQSYMGDKSSIMFYFLPEEFNGDHPEYEDKVKRCVFYLGEDKLIQSRVYPDGRDGGDRSLAGDIRNIMQRLVSQLWDVPNYWSLEKGTCACGNMTLSYGPHYRDYLCYGDCNVSFLKRIDGYKNTRKVIIGTEGIICPKCGKVHDREDNIFCEECSEDKVKCAHCGDYVWRDEAYEIDGEWYCSDCTTYCHYCDERVVYDDTPSTNDGRCVCPDCLSSRYTWSDYDDEYVRNDEVIRSEEGNVFHIDSDGYFICESCGECHDFSESNWDEETDSYYCNECMTTREGVTDENNVA